MSTENGGIINGETERVAVGELVLHEENPRIGDVEAIMASIRENGFYGSLVVQRGTNRILVGNHRYRAALELGFEELPVTWVDVSDNRAAKLLLVDNRTGDLSEYDDPQLVEILQWLRDSDGEAGDGGGLLGTGYTDDDLAELADAMELPEEFPVYDEDAADSVRRVICPNCEHSFAV